jgi:predicted small secreted protein
MNTNGGVRLSPGVPREDAMVQPLPTGEKGARTMSLFTKLILLTMVVAVAGVGLQGCNTFRGAGKDIQQGGQAMENAATEVEAWERNQHTIVSSAERGGSIQPSGVTNKLPGSSQTYRITPASGFRVTDVLIDGQSAGPVTQHTFRNVRAGHTIVASFAPHSDR